MTATIEVFADLGCPFTHVGLLRVTQRRDELGRTDVRLLVRAWPLEIVNGTPLDPDFIAEEVEEIHEQVAGDAFVGFRQEAFPATSIPGMALAARGYDVGPDVGEAISLELRALLFERGVDVADPAVLAEVASRHGVAASSSPDDDRARVEADLQNGRARGVIGSPHFFTRSGDFFCPSLDIRRDAAGHLRITADPEGFDAFVVACLEG